MTTETPAAAMFRRIEALRDDCIQRGCNKHDQVQALVPACIDEGIATGPEIIATLGEIGFNERHVGIQLHANLDHFWQRDSDRFYTVLPPLA